MTALAIVTASPPPIDFTSWLDTGRNLLSERTAIEWQLADWLATGRETFGNQAAFDFLGDELGIDPKRLKSAAKVSALFPPALRAAGLTFEHHEAVVNLPAPDALAVLKRAEADKLDDRETRVAAVQRRAEIAPSLLPEEDWEQAMLLNITRAWNRAPASVRREFMDLAEEANGGDIDA